MEHRTGDHPESCKEIFAELSAYLDAELPEQACREIETHLSSCPPCIEFVNSLRRTVELCRQYQHGALPAPLAESARERLLAAYHKAITARKTLPEAR